MIDIEMNNKEIFAYIYVFNLYIIKYIEVYIKLQFIKKYSVYI